MSNVKTLALALCLGTMFAGSAGAQTCLGPGSTVRIDSAGRWQDVEVVDHGNCNYTGVVQRGQNQRGRVVTEGVGHTTRMTQIGRNQSVDLRVRGRGTETHVFTGICPKGSPGWNLDVAGDRRLDVIVLPCR
jgi:hypothetical protein